MYTPVNGTAVNKVVYCYNLFYMNTYFILKAVSMFSTMYMCSHACMCVRMCIYGCVFVFVHASVRACVCMHVWLRYQQQKPTL